MQKAILNARALLKDEEGVEITDFRDVPFPPSAYSPKILGR